MAEATKTQPLRGISAPCARLMADALREIRAISIKDVATMLCMDRSLKRFRAGTIRKPPPTPNMPENKPATAPIEAKVAVPAGVQRRRPVSGFRRQGV